VGANGPGQPLSPAIDLNSKYSERCPIIQVNGVTYFDITSVTLGDEFLSF